MTRVAEDAVDQDLAGLLAEGGAGHLEDGRQIRLRRRTKRDLM
jgi:hypothetical protein